MVTRARKARVRKWSEASESRGEAGEKAGKEGGSLFFPPLSSFPLGQFALSSPAELRLDWLKRAARSLDVDSLLCGLPKKFKESKTVLHDLPWKGENMTASPRYYDMRTSLAPRKRTHFKILLFTYKALHHFFIIFFAHCLCRNFFQVNPSARIFFSDKYCFFWTVKSWFIVYVFVLYKLFYTHNRSKDTDHFNAKSFRKCTHSERLGSHLEWTASRHFLYVEKFNIETVYG